MDFSTEKFAIVGPIKWSFNKKGGGVLIRKNGDEDVETIMHLHWKGSAKTILRMCSHYYDSEGNIHALEDQKSKFEQVIRDMEDDGLRPIAFAYKPIKEREIREDGLILLALVGFKCKIGEDDKSAVKALRNAGVSIKLVSQDELQKAIKIAFELGICSRGSNDVVALEEGMQLLSMEGQQQLTLAIREADVGIVEATLNTEMAREGSDIIVSPGRGLRPFTPLLRHGRCAYHNIQRFIQLQLTACISGLLITVVVTICSGESPITAIQLLWVNYIICILGGRMMVMEPAAQALMAHQPQAKRTKSLMTNFMWRTFVTQVFYQASVSLIIQFMGQAVHALKQEEWNSMIFNTFTLCQVFNLFNAMELEKKEIFVVVIRDYRFLMALVVVMGMHVVFIELATTLVVGYA
ncbi:hypothetical protein F0562_008199 [Nyssa sinensis]|uniref:Cation-transporting P-type ATPase C-terminal domain-containing protein n=1 Tax=Nyssa sinensis TaxID=561372 RepID=A0A5J5A993_9ASTE|nr:hypothetical protein F0562_008199 [Nyssa sinensis]